MTEIDPNDLMKQQDEREERAAQVHEKLTGVTRVETPAETKKAEPEKPVKSMFTQEEADALNEDLEWWEK